ncbi:MAG: hypothetical protein H6745_07450 [Deltaproteobacteria bacterium]|nr:hypothetical protein [Deltaproteobacteria bacterium]
MTRMSSLLALALTGAFLTVSAGGCAHRYRGEPVYVPVQGEDGETYLVESPELTRDVARAQRLQAREEARAAKLHAREMRRQEKIAAREARRAAKLEAREAARAEKLRRRWEKQQLALEARHPDGYVVEAPPMAPSLPAYPFGPPAVVAAPDADADADVMPEPSAPAAEAPADFVAPPPPSAGGMLAFAFGDALNQQRAWRRLPELASDPELDALAARYAEALAAAERKQPDARGVAAIEDAEDALGGALHTAFLLDPRGDYDPDAVVAWLLDDDARRDVLLAAQGAAVGVGVAEVGGVRVVVFVVEQGAEG